MLQKNRFMQKDFFEQKEILDEEKNFFELFEIKDIFILTQILNKPKFDEDFTF